jgi:hypothetical protein
MLRRVALSRTDVLEGGITSIFRVTRIDELGRASAVTSNRNPHVLQYFFAACIGCKFLAHQFLSPDDGGDMFLRNISSYKSHPAYTPEDDILHCHRRENLKSFIALTGWVM